jgi:putative transposase
LIFSEPDRSDGSKPSDRFPKKQPLVQGISTLLSSYTQAINKQYDSSGSLFRSKTKAIPLIETELRSSAKGNLEHVHYSEKCFHYIHENPVKAKLVKKAEKWEFV